ncbi:hypothetical protein BO221_39110 [Archangium sp. Cb G35]|uniref:hypothetical protein n=1 Tax=Archangium sp. Cb G35 TaxID=1920190 RepID=UPI000937FDAD|nr:hypothetical protein [Archangium sp. Cb G35]OJT18747.1 hypothetical protein BO221_39110 [Archangium sp. Cb G35]
MTAFISKSLPATVLLLSCAVAGCDNRVDVNNLLAEKGLDGSPVVLGASSPTARRQITVDVRPANEERGDIQSLSLDFSIKPSLQGVGSEEHGRPWLRARVLQASDGLVVTESLWVLGEPGFEGYLNGIYIPGCTRKEHCEAAYVLELERQGPPTAGELHLTWRTQARLIWTDPDESTVAMTLREE